MIRIKPEQNVTKRKAGIFRVHHLFKSSVFHIILSVCVCVCACALWICQCHQFIFVVALHFGLFYLTNYKRAVVVVVFFVSPMYSRVCVCEHDHFALRMFSTLLEVCHFISVHACSALFHILRMNLVHFLCGVFSNKIIQNAKPPQK